MKTDRARGWKIRAREASWRCWAMESAIRRRAATLSAVVFAGVVVRVGREARGSVFMLVFEAGDCWEEEKVVVVVTAVARGEGRGREEVDAGRDGGVEAGEEDMSLVGEKERKGSVVSVRWRFARREVKNAGGCSHVSLSERCRHGGIARMHARTKGSKYGECHGNIKVGKRPDRLHPTSNLRGKGRKSGLDTCTGPKARNPITDTEVVQVRVLVT